MKPIMRRLSTSRPSRIVGTIDSPVAIESRNRYEAPPTRPYRDVGRSSRLSVTRKAPRLGRVTCVGKTSFPAAWLLHEYRYSHPEPRIPNCVLFVTPSTSALAGGLAEVALGSMAHIGATDGLLQAREEFSLTWTAGVHALRSWCGIPVDHERWAFFPAKGENLRRHRLWRGHECRTMLRQLEQFHEQVADASASHPVIEPYYIHIASVRRVWTMRNTLQDIVLCDITQPPRIPNREVG